MIDAVDNGTCFPCWKAFGAVLDCSNVLGLPGGPNPVDWCQPNPGGYCYSVITSATRI